MASENDDEAIEEEFVESWNGIENFYQIAFDSPRWQYLQLIHRLIADLRQRGYDRQLRAGQSLATFILSRSRKHGLRRDQARLKIDLNPEGGMKVAYWESPDVEVDIENERVEITRDIEHLLQRLLSHPID